MMMLLKTHEIMSLDYHQRIELLVYYAFALPILTRIIHEGVFK